MLKKNIIILSLILFLTNCGFTPIYLKNNNLNFSIEEIKYTGDRDLNNFLKINLDRYKSEKINNKIFINGETKYKKNILSKDSTGKITSYQLEVEVEFVIKSTNKKIRITEKKIIDSMDDKFEEARYEKSIKKSFANSISKKLISELIVNQ
jgi:outer membrane lipopolysaccharide assembly protein LptE/RlpB